MNIKSEICSSFCNGLVIRKVPVGYSVSTPFHWFSGDNVNFYIRIKENIARIEDSGTLLFDLQGQGLDISSENRMLILSQLLEEYEVHFSEDDGIFYTNWVPKDEVHKLAIPFMIFLFRIQDILFLNREVVENTFLEDLIGALKKEFGDDYVHEKEAPIPSLPYFIVDIVVRPPNGKTAAIFPATSDVNVLQAAVFSLDIEKHKIKGVVPFLIYEDLESPKISKRNREIAMNTDLFQAVWSGGKADVIEKVKRHVLN